MRGRFRSDLELAPGGGFRLRRKRRARLLSALLAAAGLLATAVDLLAGRPIVAAAQLALSLAFVLLFIQAELGSWRFEDGSAVRRTFSIRALRIREVRLDGRQIRRVALAVDAGRARAWIETSDGEDYALVEGDPAEVQRIVDRLSATIRLSTIEPSDVARH